MEKGEFFRDDKDLEVMLTRLSPDTMLHFDGPSIHILAPFDPNLSLSEMFPDKNITFSSFESHNRHLLDEFLRVKTAQEMNDLPLEEEEKTFTIPEALLREWDAIDDQELYPTALDVSHLIEERKSMGETFIADVRAYAAQLLAGREDGNGAPIPCEACETVPNPQDYPCIQCNNTGYIPLDSILLTNLENQETSILRIDPIEWLASGELDIRWRDRDEVGSIQAEGFFVDIEAFMAKKLRTVGIDLYDSIEVYHREHPLIFAYSFRQFMFYIDENMFVPDALELINKRTANYIRNSLGGSHSIGMRTRRASSDLFDELRTTAEKLGFDLGYTHKTSRDTDWEYKHAFLLISPDGHHIVDIIPDALLSDLDDTNLAMEFALEWLVQILLIKEAGGDLA